MGKMGEFLGPLNLFGDGWVDRSENMVGELWIWGVNNYLSDRQKIMSGICE